jgi:hypothetical protein
MANFSPGDVVRVVTGTRNGQLGKIKNIVPNVTADEHFQAYVVVFSDATTMPEHYLQYELQPAS